MKGKIASEKFEKMMYIMQAMVEYLISILVAGSFLATLTGELGISDSLTGILSSIISLGCLFQLMSVSIRRTRVKRLVISFSIINQLLFMLLYLLPLSKVTSQVKIAGFVIIIFVAYVIYNLVHPKKINWMMSQIEDQHRGTFTANKEIVSLIAGMLFSFLMGTVTDYFAESGQIKTAFVITAAVIFFLMIVHSLSMLFTPEQEMISGPQKSLSKAIKEIINNKNVLRITVVFVIYNIASYASVPFLGTYQINELDFSLQFVSILTICSSVVRISVSRFWGRYADKNSFAVMVEKCFIAMTASFLCIICAVPSNGKIMFVLYYIFYGIAMGGINSALTNLIFDYVPYEQRADSLAVCQSISGVVGFLTTLLISPLVALIQRSNRFLGISLYAQQVVAVISVLFMVIVIIYVKKSFINKEKTR